MWFLFQFLLYCALLVMIFAVGGAAIVSGDVNQLMAGAGAVILIAGSTSSPPWPSSFRTSL